MSHDPTIAACPPPDRLAAFDRGDLADDELAGIADHLGACPHCQARLAAAPGEADADSLVRDLRRLAGASDTAPASRTGRPEPARGPDATGVYAAGGETPHNPDPYATLPGAPPPSTAADPKHTPSSPTDTYDPRATHAQSAPPAEVGTDAADTFGPYQILGKLGEGGMGVVYKAHDPRLKRTVALKVIKGSRVSPEERRRFAAEAEAVARLEHPNVVRIYELGEVGGQPYATLEYVPGGSLADRLKSTLPDHRSAAQVMVPICRGVHAAHELKLVHRDLKPANVLVSGDRGTSLGACVPKVTDFGLAKFLDEDSGLSRANAVMGTPSYMPPEQAEGRADLGPAADVYALGATLYDLLTGRAPFKGTTIRDTLRMVVEQEPVPPRQIQAKVPRDLETICLKCLEKSPDRRYATAAALADDLQRFLDGEPITARPVGRPEKLWRWCKRKPVVAGLASFSILSAVALLVGAFWFTYAVADERRQKEVAEERAGRDRAELETAAVRQQSAEDLRKASQYFARVTQARERITGRAGGWAWRAADDVREAARIDTPARNPAELRSALAACLAGTDVRESRAIAPGFYSRAVCFHPNGRWVVLGQGRVGGADHGDLSVLIADALTGDTVRKFSFPVGVIGGLFDGKPDMTNAVAVSPDGRWLVAAARSGLVHRWDLRQPNPTAVTWSPEVVGFGKTAECLDAVFAPDGSALYVSVGIKDGGGITRWDAVTWKQTARHATAPGWGALAVHPRGEAVYCTGADFRSRALEPVSLEKVADFGEMDVQAVSPDGRAVAVVRLGRLELRNPRTGNVVLTFREPYRELAFSDKITGVRFSPDGRLLAAWAEHDRHVYLWDVATGERVAAWRSPEGTSHSAFDPTGRFLVVAGAGGTTVLDIHGQREHRTVAVQPYRVVSAAVSPDGHTLGTVSSDHPGAYLAGLPALWNLTADAAPDPFWTDERFGFDRLNSGAAFSPDGSLFAGVAESEVRVFDRRKGGTRVAMTDVEGMHECAFAADGRLWFLADDRVHCAPLPIADRKSLKWTNPDTKFTGLGRMVSLDSRKTWVAVGGLDGTLRLFPAAVPHDAPEFAPERQFRVEPRVSLGAVALAPDEAVALVGTLSGKAHLVSLADGALLQSWVAHGDAVQAAAWLAPGLLVTGGRDRVVRFWSWDGATARELWANGTASAVTGLGRSADGRILSVTCEAERGVHVWDVAAVNRRFEEVGLGIPVPPAWGVPRLPAAEPPPTVPDESGWPVTGLRCEFFADDQLRSLRAVVHDPTVYRNWGVGGPHPHVPNRFSARWTGFVKAPAAGRYEFRLTAGSAARAWVDGKLLAERWETARTDDATLAFTAELTGEPQAVRVEYLHARPGAAFVTLFWACPGKFPEQPVPETYLFHDPAAAKAARVPAIPRPAGEELRLTAEGATAFTRVAVSRDGRFIAAGSAEGGLFVWARAGGKPVLARPKAHAGAVTSLELSPDGALLISASAADGLIAWDAATGKPRARHPGHGGAGVVTFAPDGESFVSAGADKAARKWGAAALDLRGVANLDFVPGAARWDASGSAVLLAGDGVGVRWEPAAAKQVALAGWAGPARALPPGAVLASEEPPHVWERGVLKLIDRATGVERWRVGSEGAVEAVALSPDDTFVAVALRTFGDTLHRWDTAVTVWDLKTGRAHRRLIGHTGGVRSVRFGPASEVLVSGGDDGTVRVWRLSP